MWTGTIRKQHARKGLRLPSNLTDAEWEVLKPFLPKRSRLGCPPLCSRREIVEAFFFAARLARVAHAHARRLPFCRDGLALFFCHA
jgi:transposase